MLKHAILLTSLSKSLKPKPFWSYFKLSDLAFSSQHQSFSSNAPRLVISQCVTAFQLQYLHWFNSVILWLILSLSLWFSHCVHCVVLFQDHYDWGLRAIKSVLVVAGSLKRGDPGRAEDQVLMRALRDFNVPKIVTDDMPVFMGLILDLFPALDVPRKRDMDFEKYVKQSVLDLKLQAEDNFVLKVIYILIYWSIFILENKSHWRIHS